MRQSRIFGGYKRCCPALHPHHLHPPHAFQDLLQGPRSQGTLGLRALRQLGEKLKKGPGELERLSQPITTMFWRVFGFWGGSLPQRHPQRGAVGSGAVQGWWLHTGRSTGCPYPQPHWGGPCRAARNGQCQWQGRSLDGSCGHPVPALPSSLAATYFT